MKDLHFVVGILVGATMTDVQYTSSNLVEAIQQGQKSGKNVYQKVGGMYYLKKILFRT